MFFFFFSSRRRHTRYWRDWSSDVCSSDLWPVRPVPGTAVAHVTLLRSDEVWDSRFPRTFWPTISVTLVTLRTLRQMDATLPRVAFATRKNLSAAPRRMRQLFAWRSAMHSTALANVSGVLIVITTQPGYRKSDR